VALLGPQLQNRATARVEEATELGHRRRVDEVLRVAERDPGLGDGFEHRVGVGERHRQHPFARLGRLAEGAGQRLLDDHVLAGLRRRDQGFRARSI